MEDEVKEFEYIKVRIKYLALSLVTLPLKILISAFVTKKLWEWFIAQTFELSEIGIVEAAGLALIIRFLTFKPMLLEDKSNEYYGIKESFKRLKESVSLDMMIFWFGWVLSMFV